MSKEIRLRRDGEPDLVFEGELIGRDFTARVTPFVAATRGQGDVEIYRADGYGYVLSVSFRALGHHFPYLFFDRDSNEVSTFRTAALLRDAIAGLPAWLQGAGDGALRQASAKDVQIKSATTVALTG